MSSSDNTANAETFVLSIKVMELKACWMALATFYTAQFTLVLPDPLPQIFVMQPAFF